MKKSFTIPSSLFTLFLLINFSCFSQEFSHADSLRGGLPFERTSFDVVHYDIATKIHPDTKSIEGNTKIRFKIIKPTNKIQLDLFENLEIHSIKMDGKTLNYTRDGNAFFVNFPKKLKENSLNELTISYSGKPRAAVRPPWDGGFSWTKDNNGKDWITLSCEGLGASVWWPCKDHPSDEPDSVDIQLIVPKDLMAVSNGNLIDKKAEGDFMNYHWKVSYPINLYNITLNIADYRHWSEKLLQYNGQELALDYYVLPYNLEKSKSHFQQVREMLLIFEKYFGPYPFPKDGYAMVETDYWGMEHQSAVAYGNHYLNNNFGFDFIIIHESAHEWFGNSISCTDHADLWIHEAFGTYAEMVYLEEKMNKDFALTYMQTKKRSIQNKYPIVGPYGVNYQNPDSDMYFKGSWFIHSLRNITNNDELWWKTMKDFCMNFYHKNTNTEEVLSFFEERLKIPVKELAKTYLFTTKIPTLVYSVDNEIMTYHWENVEGDFKMSVPYSDEMTKKSPLMVSTKPQTISVNGVPKFHDENYLIQLKKQ
jgi:aminopeptidase N